MLDARPRAPGRRPARLHRHRRLAGAGRHRWRACWRSTARSARRSPRSSTASTPAVPTGLFVYGRGKARAIERARRPRGHRPREPPTPTPTRRPICRCCARRPPGRGQPRRGAGPDRARGALGDAALRPARAPAESCRRTRGCRGRRRRRIGGVAAHARRNRRGVVAKLRRVRLRALRLRAWHRRACLGALGARDVRPRPRARRAVLDDLGEPVEPLYTEADLPADLDGAIGLPGRVPVHARRLRVDVPRAAVDDAPVRRLRHARGDQRALPVTCSSTGRPGSRPRSTCRR